MLTSDTDEARYREILDASPPGLTGERRAAFERFLHNYLATVVAADLHDRSAEDINGAILNHWQLAQQRPGESRVLRLFNADYNRDGWHTPHSVLQLVAPDQRFLVSTIQALLASRGLAIQLLVHPILAVKRDAEGTCLAIDRGDTDIALTAADTDGIWQRESFIALEFERLDETGLESLRALLEQRLSQLAEVHREQPGMRAWLHAHMESRLDEAQRALHPWLAQNAFTCLGTATLRLSTADTADTDDTSDTASDCRGLLASHPDGAGSAPAALSVAAISPKALAAAASPHEPLLICKSPVRSPVIRDEFADLVMLFDADGQHVHCALGLFNRARQQQSADAWPWLQERIQAVIARSSAAADSHDGQTLAAVLRKLPRDMLTQAAPERLLEMAEGIVAVNERQQIRLFGSSDPLGGFYNCLVYIPRDSYSRELRLTIETLLLQALDGNSAEFHMRYSSESMLARLHFIIERRTRTADSIDWDDIEQRIRDAAISWHDRLLASLRAEFDESTALDRYRQYGHAFPASYRESYSARAAVADIEFIEGHVNDDAPVMSFYRQVVEADEIANFKLFSIGSPVFLSDVLPLLENMGLRIESEHPFELARGDGINVWIHEFTVRHTAPRALNPQAAAGYLQAAFERVWRGDIENDGFNRLILRAGLTWRQVVVLRGYCKYLLQVGVPFSQEYMIDSLLANASIVADLVVLFETRFDPARDDHESDAASERLLERLDAVESLDQDRILRYYLRLVLATVRTNHYRCDETGRLRDSFSVKLDSHQVPDLPSPKPLYEIFVYSPRVEGIHLRGGRVARGGLRWSDRREDFRTEVLGLMKAQMVKNAVIVPVGSKGGFYVKLPALTDAAANRRQAIECYREFLRGLLDLTDNIVAGAVLAPDGVVRHDGDDPYLVVAADKGTATFSDHANAISAEYGFWLGDAFASGGSAGYDHKAMGITARGAWESVKRHFRETGLDTQSHPFTVVGIGDMGGDVFGNGLLLSPHARLVAAFNHRHIFIDPSPDNTRAFAERQRLFAEVCGWEAYDTALLSAGGGIYRRDAKHIDLSDEAMQALGTEVRRHTPTALIATLLRAPVDLLWNGGIGTYVKSAAESHADAADRANDAVRINADALRCRVIGEGGNLGLTQLARIDFARRGGSLYTDAIDNSAGVDCSDHEVNIKILLNAVEQRDRMTRTQRDELLASMTDDVATLVLKDNILQTQCIGIARSVAGAELEEQSRFIEHLEAEQLLDRQIEYLPGKEEIAERLAVGEGLCNPELAVLVAYSKMTLYQALLNTDLAQEDSLLPWLVEYFPPALREQHGEDIASHHLRREITCTIVGNAFVNRLGPTFAFRMQQELGADVRDILAAFVAVCRIFELPGLWSGIESLDHRVPADVQYRMHVLVRGLVERACHWLLRTRRASQPVESLTDAFADGVRALREAMPGCLSQQHLGTLEQRVRYFVDAGVPEALAEDVAIVVPLSSALDIVEIASASEQAIAGVAAVYFELGGYLELDWLREQIGALTVGSRWHRLARSELRTDLHYQQRHLCAEILAANQVDRPAAERVQRWAARNRHDIELYRDLVTDMKAGAAVDFAMLSLAVNEVHKLLRRDRPLGATH